MSPALQADSLLTELPQLDVILILHSGAARGHQRERTKVQVKKEGWGWPPTQST